jgi:hypothetical protein
MQLPSCILCTCSDPGSFACSRRTHVRTINARQWSLAHGIDEYGVELELPRSLPDEQYSGTLGLHPPYNLVLPLRFTKLSTSPRQLDVVFPVPGFVFGRRSQPWLQVLVRDRYAPISMHPLLAQTTLHLSLRILFYAYHHPRQPTYAL